jgi:hypothetical protein
MLQHSRVTRHAMLAVLCAVAGSVHAEDLHAFISPADVTDTSFYAGYNLLQLNTTRVCEAYVSDECVSKRGGDVCVLQQV